MCLFIKVLSTGALTSFLTLLAGYLTRWALEKRFEPGTHLLGSLQRALPEYPASDNKEH